MGLKRHSQVRTPLQRTLNNIDIQQFWEIEDIGKDNDMSSSDQRVMEFYKNTTTRREDGSYEVRLPLKSNINPSENGSQLGESKGKAIAQFKQLERKFYKHQNITKEYKSFINEYLSLNHMTLAAGNQTPNYYLPRHCVIN